MDCSIQPQHLDKQRGTRIYENIILNFYSSTTTNFPDCFPAPLMWNRKAIGKISRTWRGCQESEEPAETDSSQNSRPYIVLKLPATNTQCLFFIGHGLHLRIACFFHWSWLTPTYCLFFIGHGLHLRIACFLLITAYTNVLLVFYWSWLTPTYCLFFIGHGLHLRIACFLLVTAYTNVLLVFYWSWLTPTYCLFFYWSQLTTMLYNYIVRILYFCNSYCSKKATLKFEIEKRFSLDTFWSHTPRILRIISIYI